MKLAFFDCFSGVAGDMIIGSLLDAGLSLDHLRLELEKLGLKGYSLSADKVVKNNISATKFDVQILEEQPYRKPKDIVEIIGNSKLDDEIKLQSIAIFNRLARAEAKVHGEPIDKIHFHEVGAVDAIVDVCGAVIGLKMLGVKKVFSSPLSLGTGRIETDHGVMPIPAPATAELVKEAPVRMTTIETELTTPTGAAVLTTLADFNAPEILEPKQVGYGAGSRDLQELPNLLRV
ncbi:MAG: LarC family nickel insertion protein, partial [Candidatus Zixiibacteriota bacterium]